MKKSNNQKQKGVWVVVLNWNNGRDTVECIDSILQADISSVEGIVVCDNGSTDDSITTIHQWSINRSIELCETTFVGGQFAATCDVQQFKLSFDVPVYLLGTGGNLGFAGGNNVGIKFIQQNFNYDLIFLLNNDAVVCGNSITLMAQRFTHKDIGMCGCTVVYYHNRSVVQAHGGARFNSWLGRASHIGAGASVDSARNADAVEAQLDYILGAALMISRTCIEAIGLMDDEYFLYYEEIDWAVRARKRGFRLAYAPNAVVFHKEGGTIGSSSDRKSRSLLSDFYLIRNRIRFSRKFYLNKLPFVFVFTIFQVSRYLLRLDLRRFVNGVRALSGGDFRRV